MTYLVVSVFQLMFCSLPGGGAQCLQVAFSAPLLSYKDILHTDLPGELEARFVAVISGDVLVPRETEVAVLPLLKVDGAWAVRTDGAGRGSAGNSF